MNIKKIRPSLPYAKRTRTDLGGINDVAIASVHSEKSRMKKMIIINRKN